MCINYRVFNKMNVKNKFHILLIVKFFDQLGGTRWLMKLNLGLGLGYYHVRILKTISQKQFIWRVM